MRIGIDASYLSEPDPGMFRYVSCLLSRLLEIDRENEYVLFYSRTPPPYAAARARAETVSYYLPKRILALQFRLPLLLRKKRIDMFHAPSYGIPFAKSVPYLSTIHDIFPSVSPSSCSFRHRLFYRGLIKSALTRSDVIIVPSNFTRSEIGRVFNIPLKKIEVIYEGVEEIFQPMKKNECVKHVEEKFHVLPPYILFVGAIEPRKNLLRLIEGFFHLREEGRWPHSLVIVGKGRYRRDQFMQTIHRRELKERVCFLGHVGDDDLVSLYNAAEVFVFPSLYEGFGLPVLEAMACGTPVVCSRSSSLPEVTGDAALIFDPRNAGKIAGTVREALESADLRAEMAEKGLERARRFSWEKTARETLEAYRRLGGDNG